MGQLTHGTVLSGSLLLLLLSGCATWYVDAYRVTVTGQRYSRQDPAQVATRTSTPAPGQFTPIAFLEYNRDLYTEDKANAFRAVNQQKIVNALQRKAAALGADAVVHVRNADGPACFADKYSVYSGWRLVTRGLAVKLAR